MKELNSAVLGFSCLVVLAALARAFYFAFGYRVFPRQSPCADLPPESIVLALGFKHQGELNGRIIPGDANLALARDLAACVNRLSLVLTQKAILDALAQEGLLRDEKLSGLVPLLPMHAHDPAQPVRTYAALAHALQKLDPLPPVLVLFAHDKQIERASWDLRSLYPGQIILWQHTGLPYAQPGWRHPLRWALRELYFARPAEAWLRWQQSKRQP